MRLRYFLLLIFCWVNGIASLAADDASLPVGVVAVAPFAMQTDGTWTGHSIELWEQIADRNQWKYHYVEYPSTEGALAAVTAGQCAVVVGDVSITSERIPLMDFSQPYFRSGLQIMILEDRPRTFGRLLEQVLEVGHLQIIWIAAIVVMVFTVLVTLFERHHNPDFPKSWHDGLADAFYNVISVTLTGKSVYKGFPGVLGRLVMVFWMLLGLFVVAYVTSSITSTMTVEQLQGRITGPDDLPGKTIGVLVGSAAVDYARNHGIQFISYPSMDEAVNALVKHEVAALVDDAPVLQYYDYQHPKIPITEVGPLFDPHTYGFALPKDSELRVPINKTLLTLSESGYLNQLGKRYFGQMFQP